MVLLGAQELLSMKFGVRINLFILFVISAHLCIGQTQLIEGIVYKTNSSQGLPYIAVGIKGTSRGTVTDLSGKFSINVLLSDSLVFSSVGFNLKIISANDFKSPFYLEEKVTELDEVIVKSKKSFRKVLVGNTKVKTNILFGGSNQYAFLIKNENSVRGLLEKLYFNIEPDINKNNLQITTIRIRVYSNQDNLPGKDLLSQNVMVKIKKKAKNVNVDISNYSIEFPPEGLFIGIDLLGTHDQNDIFTPYNKSKTPLNLRIEFSEGASYLTYKKFFGTDWSIVTMPERNGTQTKVSAKFGAKIIY